MTDNHGDSITAKTAVNRNKRMLAGIQSTLRSRGAGNEAGAISDNTNTASNRNAESDSLMNVDSIIEKLDNVRLNVEKSTTTAADIQRLIPQAPASLDQAEWSRLTKALIDCALVENNAHFAVKICKTLIVHSGFQLAMEEQLPDECARFILTSTIEDRQRYSNFCQLFAALLVADYPRRCTKAIAKENSVLFTLISAFKGWVIVVTEDQDDDNVEGENKTTEMAEKCAAAIAKVCRFAKRRLWMQWPELVDEIYVAIKSALIGTRFTSETRKALLEVLLDMHTWPQQGRIAQSHSPKNHADLRSPGKN